MRTTPLSIDVSPKQASAASWTVTIQLAAATTGDVRLLWKSFDGRQDWQAAPAAGSGSTYQATVPGTDVGAFFAVEVAGVQGDGHRYPDPRTSTPYVVLAP